MGTLHLNKLQPDAKRAEMLATRVVEGMRTLDQDGRRVVLQQIGASFCTRCGSLDPACRCSQEPK